MTAAKDDGEVRQPWLFGYGAPVDVEDVLLEMVRPAEVFAAEGAGESVPGPKTAALVPGVPGQRRFSPVSSSAQQAPKSRIAAAGRDERRRGADCKHTG